MTTTEDDLLQQFLQHPRRVLPKEFPMDHVSGYGCTGSDDLVEVDVKRLRQEPERAEAARLIHPVGSAGYVLWEE